MKYTRLLFATVFACSSMAGAQDHATMDHSKMNAATGALPTLPGQDAYGAIAEVVRILQADPKTDWSKVNIEALRQHLIDMNEVTLHSAVKQVQIPGGLEITATGPGRAEAAIRRMTTSHGAALAPLGLTTTSKPVAGGAIFTVVATDPTNANLVAQVRALGFAGVMTLGDHHAPHHIAMARGESMTGHSPK